LKSGGVNIRAVDKDPPAVNYDHDLEAAAGDDDVRGSSKDSSENSNKKRKFDCDHRQQKSFRGNNSHSTQSVGGNRSADQPFNDYHGQFSSWTAVHALTQQSGARCDSRSGTKLVHLATASGAAACAGAERALFLCYPPPGDRMGEIATRAYREAGGQVFIYVGEFHGDTGTKELELELCSHWRMATKCALPTFGDTAYHLSVWETKTKTNHPQGVGVAASLATGNNCMQDDLAQFVCAACGNSCTAAPAAAAAGESTKSRGAKQQKKAKQSKGGVVFRDRFTRSVCACSRECAESAACIEAVRTAMSMRGIALPPPGGSGFELPASAAAAAGSSQKVTSGHNRAATLSFAAVWRKLQM
jgi:hypothetical protein